MSGNNPRRDWGGEWWDSPKPSKSVRDSNDKDGCWLLGLAFLSLPVGLVLGVAAYVSPLLH